MLWDSFSSKIQVLKFQVSAFMLAEQHNIMEIPLDCNWVSKWKLLSCVQLFATSWTVTCQAPLFIGLSTQEYWRGLPCLPPGDLLGPGTEPISLMSPVLTGGFLTTNATWEAQSYLYSMETGLWFLLPSGLLRETIQDALLVFRTCLWPIPGVRLFAFNQVKFRIKDNRWFPF